MADYTIAILEDAISILEFLLDGDEPLSLAALTRKSEFSKNKVFRILYTLEKHQYVARTETGAYRLGLRFFDFGLQVQREMSLLEASQPIMDWLVEETRESIFLGVVDGSEVLCVDARESPRSIRLYAEVGRRAPVYTGGVPKVLLAFLPQDARTALLDEVEFRPITPYTIIDRNVLEEVLADVRRQGYIVAADDLDEGAHSIAAPIRDHTGKVVAGISIAGPSHRFTDEHIKRYVALVLEAAERISRALGHNPHAAETAVPATADAPDRR